MSTFAETVEQLKHQYTDKYVKVDARRPELARFRDVVGQVKTVNMNGRALVQFLNYHQNVGWHDIDLSCLTVVDAPPPEVTEKAEPKRAQAAPAGTAAPTAGAKQVADAKTTAEAGAKKLSPLELARMQGASGKGGAAAPAAKPPAGGTKSTADILAAARGGSKPAAAPASGAKKSTADILAAARGGAAPGAKVAAAPVAPIPAAPSQAPAKPAGKLSTADILAAARGKAGAPAGAVPGAPAPEPPIAQPQAAAAPPPAPAPPAPIASPAVKTSGVVKVDRSSMSVDEMIAYCRQKDAQ